MRAVAAVDWTGTGEGTVGRWRAGTSGQDQLQRRSQTGPIDLRSSLLGSPIPSTP